MLVKDETEGCISRVLPKISLSKPHFSSLIDLDGDCVSDLFLTVEDISTGTHFYEIYLRRERTSISDNDKDAVENSEKSINTGLNSYCLVSREEIPTKSVFKFTDIDRDGMIDMVFLNELNVNIHYNRLPNEMRA